MSELDDTRIRLLKAATEVFSEHGYHAATTREICRRANANLAAIHYHFGDKAELYREVFKLPFLEQSASIGLIRYETLDLDASLTLFYRVLMAPIFEDGMRTQQFMRLHAREEIDPSGVLGDVVTQAIRPNFEQLLKLLCSTLNVAQADTEIERLAFCMVGMGRIFFHGKCAVNAFSPTLLQGEDAMQGMIKSLVGYAKDLIASEVKKRLTN